MKKIRKKSGVVEDQLLRPDLRKIVNEANAIHGFWEIPTLFDDRTAKCFKEIMYWAIPKANGQPKGAYKDDKGRWAIVKTDREFIRKVAIPLRAGYVERTKMVELGYIETYRKMMNGQWANYIIVTKKGVEVVKGLTRYLRENKYPESKKEVQLIMDKIIKEIK